MFKIKPRRKNMKLGNKRTLGIVLYYTLAVMAVLTSGFFVFTLILNDLSMWAKVIYFVWVAGVVACILFDFVLTNNRENKHITGWITYVLSLLSVAMLVILFAMNSGFKNLADLKLLSSAVSIIPIIISGFLIAMWCVGDHLNQTATNSSSSATEIK